MTEYMAPEMEVIEIKYKSALLVVSTSDEDDDNPMGGGEGNNPNVPFG